MCSTDLVVDKIAAVDKCKLIHTSGGGNWSKLCMHEHGLWVRLLPIGGGRSLSYCERFHQNIDSLVKKDKYENNREKKWSCYTTL